jgi:alpha-glucosidase
MNGLSPRDYTLDTSIFLVKGKKYRVELYQDDPTLKTRTGVSSSVLTVKAGRKLPLHLLASGGAALRFTPIK